MFSVRERPPTIVEDSSDSNQECQEVLDIEDMGNGNKSSSASKPILVTTTTNNRRSNDENAAPPGSGGGGSKRKHSEIDNTPRPKCNWREVLGPAPKLADAGLQTWLKFQKRKWLLQIEFRQQCKSNVDRARTAAGLAPVGNISRSITNFVQKSTNSKMQKPWQILRIAEQSNSIGFFKMWILVDADLFAVSVKINRQFLVNQLKPMEKESSALCRKTSRHLPRCQPVYNLYEYSIPEEMYQRHKVEIMEEFANPNVEGVYELNVPLMFSMLMKLGCVCGVKKSAKLIKVLEKIII